MKKETRRAWREQVERWLDDPGHPLMTCARLREGPGYADLRPYEVTVIAQARRLARADRYGHEARVRWFLAYVEGWLDHPSHPLMRAETIEGAPAFERFKAKARPIAVTALIQARALLRARPADFSL